MNVGRREWRYLKNGLLSEERHVRSHPLRTEHEHVLIKGYVVDPDELEHAETHEMLATLDRKARALTA